ncbi:MAG: PQQ-dependent sugar dehydrogenase [Ignavibacteria bacterium]|nr:PQQ-dependent sugar dehydrogenase [Ignavibacteria bacterium]
MTSTKALIALTPTILSWLIVLWGVLASKASTAQTLPLLPTKLTVPARYAPFYRSTANLTVPDSLRLPKGFRASVFHAGMMKPRFFAWSPSGVLHVVDMSAEAVFALPDRNGDGIADTSYVAAAPVKEAHNVVFYQGAMLVAEPTRVLRFLDRDGDGIYETRSVFIDSIPNGGVFNHYTRTLLADTLRNAFYLSVGAPCDACRTDNPERAAILRFNSDGSGRRIFATGLRNAIGMALEPATGLLWATNADRNGLGEEKPEEIVTTVPDGSYHGWPLAFSNSARRSEWANLNASSDYRAMLPLTQADSMRFASLKIAEAYLPAHSTPMGIAFYSGNLLPPFFRNAAFVAVHGSYSTDSRRIAAGYNVAVMRRDAASGAYTMHDFLNGFLTDSLAYTHWGRPCGVGFSPEGELYVSSDGMIGAIYRISYTPENVPNGRYQDFPSSVSPNPSADALSSRWLDYTAPSSGTMQLQIADARGAILASSSAIIKAGNGSFNLAAMMPDVLVSGASGAYFYRLLLTDVSGKTSVSQGNFTHLGR